MKYIRYAVVIALAIVLATVAFANRGPVSLNLLPDALEPFLPWAYSIQLPLFVVIFAGIIVGLMLGYLLEWLREHKHRAAVREERRRAERLEREVGRLREEQHAPGDDVLALLEETRPAR